MEMMPRTSPKAKSKAIKSTSSVKTVEGLRGKGGQNVIEESKQLTEQLLGKLFEYYAQLIDSAETDNDLSKAKDNAISAKEKLIDVMLREGISKAAGSVFDNVSQNESIHKDQEED